MTGRPETAAAVVAGLGAGWAFGTGVALQYRQVQLAPVSGRGLMRLLAHVARQRLWLLGIALAAAAYGLQALALALGPLTLVAPVTATDLLFALPLVAYWSRRPMRRRDWAGCVLTGGGIAAFLVASPPMAGRSDASTADWAQTFVAVALVAAGAVTAAGRSRGPFRAGLLALSAGVVYGFAAALMLSVTRLVRSRSLGPALGHWQLWALVALLIVGMFLSASMLRAGALSASLPVVDTVEPVSAVLIGTLLFGEPLATSLGGLALQFAGAGTAIAGIILLGRYVPAISLAPPGRPTPPHHHRAITPSAPAPGCVEQTDGKADDMTGSLLGIIITPIVTVFVLAAWLILVFYADARPEWRHQASSDDTGNSGAADTDQRDGERDRDEARAA